MGVGKADGEWTGGGGDEWWVLDEMSDWWLKVRAVTRWMKWIVDVVVVMKQEVVEVEAERKEKQATVSVVGRDSSDFFSSTVTDVNRNGAYSKDGYAG
jgi:hypothetical protein